jgi:hypothetical protein
MAGLDRYRGRRLILTTMHGKERAIAPPIARALDVTVEPSCGIDTDRLGTFAGEIPRRASMLDTAIVKARLGMAEAGCTLGVASEGSFGPHPALFVVPCAREVLVLVDDEQNLAIHETLLTEDTNFGNCVTVAGEDLEDFLTAAGFPGHALIVRPNSGAAQPIFKGLGNRDALDAAIADAAQRSADRKARIETDMRAHLNPTRMATLAILAERLAARILSCCPVCDAPGWGRIDLERGLPCAECGQPTEWVAAEINGCAKCAHRERTPRADGLRQADAANCGFCNP